MTRPDRLPIDPAALLNCDSIATTPIDLDWTETDPDTWTFHEATTCDSCGRVVVVTSFGQECADADQPEDEDEDEDEDAPMFPARCRHEHQLEGPMMSYYYPIRIRDCAAAARAIAHLPLCVVEFTGGEREGETGLALTGGGMDLSWEICEAFVLLDHRPPTHFAKLPRMGVRGATDRDRALIEICRESFRIAARWALNGVGDLDRDFSPAPADRRAERVREIRNALAAVSYTDDADDAARLEAAAGAAADVLLAEPEEP